MKEKVLTGLVIVSLVLSVFNLVLLLRTNGGTEILGQTSGVTWKIECNYTLISDYAFPQYALTVSNISYYSYIPMWNATITLQWTNGTIQVFEVGNPYFSGGGTQGIQEVVVLPPGLLYGGVPRSSWNVTSITAY